MFARLPVERAIRWLEALTTDDATVLAGTFDRTDSSNTSAENDRFDGIMDGIDLLALSWSATLAHEIGHLFGAVHVRDRYDGDAARVWTDASGPGELRENIAALPGFGEMKVKALGSVLAKRFGVEAAHELVPWHPTLGDVDSPQALADYQAAKRAHKAEWSAA